MIQTIMDNETNETNTTCIDPPKDELLYAEFWLIAVFGTTVCTVGVCFNVALLQVLLQRKLRTTYLIYLLALAIVDIAILITYLLLIVVPILYEYIHSYTLYVIWHYYMRYFYTLSRIVTLASTYLVLACTVERYWEVLELKRTRLQVNMTQTKRYAIIAGVLLASIAFRSAVFFEITVHTRHECQGTMAYMNVVSTELRNVTFYKVVYSFWSVHVVSVFLPFPALVFLNVAITLTWRNCILGMRRCGSAESKKYMARSIAARNIMVAIVTSYLVCNILQLLITFWEHIDYEFLRRHNTFYAFAADTVSLLTSINASLRLPIYYASNPTIRTAVKQLWFAKSVANVYNQTRNNLLAKRMTPTILTNGNRARKEDRNSLVSNDVANNNFGHSNRNAETQQFLGNYYDVERVGMTPC